MNPESPRRGKTTVAPEVLVTIAKLSALSVPGVAHTSPLPPDVSRLFARGAGDGIYLEIREDRVRVDVYLVVNAHQNLRAVGQAVQQAVARAMHEMAGMEVRAVNIHIADIAYPTAPKAAAPEKHL